MSNKRVSFELGVYLDVEFGECLIQTNTWNKDNAVLRIEKWFPLESNISKWIQGAPDKGSDNFTQESFY